MSTNMDVCHDQPAQVQWSNFKKKTTDGLNNTIKYGITCSLNDSSEIIFDDIYTDNMDVDT